MIASIYYENKITTGAVRQYKVLRSKISKHCGNNEKITACALTRLGSNFSLLPSRLEILLRKTLYCLPAYAVILHYETPR